MKIANLKAGRELDKLIAEKVFGGACRGGFQCPDCGSDHFGTCNPLAKEGEIVIRDCHNCSWKGPAIEACAPYSTEIESAWELVEFFDRLLPWICQVDDDQGKWFCDITQSDCDIMYADTPELAICFAALAATEEEGK